MIATARPMPKFPVSHSAAILVAVAVAGFAVAMAVLLKLARMDQLMPALATLGACLLGSLVALEPVRQAGGRPITYLQSALGLTMMLRLVISAGVTVAITFFASLEILPMALWAVGWYLLLLAAEVVVLVRYLRAAADPMAQAARSPVNQ